MDVVGMARFSGRVALVTGAGAGIGAATARALAREGAAVALVDVDRAAVAGLAAELGTAAPSTVDVADPGQVDRAVDGVVAAHGRLDIVIHCAGVDDAEAKQRIAERVPEGRSPDITVELTDERWRRVLAINLDGTFHVLRAALRVMIPRGTGAIVTIGSSAAFDAPVGYPHYAASKAGVHALSQAVAKEVISHGIRVNVVAPGPTETGMAARTPAALRESFSGSLVRPYASPEEIADVALFLASDAAANLVGAVLLANGGRFTG
jgi:3-oxoacyl-[acyl-carrier protein] reductase